MLMFKISLTRYIYLVISSQCIIIKRSEIRVSGLEKNCRKRKFSLYEENKVEAVQDTERPKAMESTKRPKPYESATVQVCRNIHLKKKKGKEEERQRNVFLCIADLKLRRGRGQMHISRGEDKLAN